MVIAFSRTRKGQVLQAENSRVKLGDVLLSLQFGSTGVDGGAPEVVPAFGMTVQRICRLFRERGAIRPVVLTFKERSPEGAGGGEGKEGVGGGGAGAEGAGGAGGAGGGQWPQEIVFGSGSLGIVLSRRPLGKSVVVTAFQEIPNPIAKKDAAAPKTIPGPALRGGKIKPGHMIVKINGNRYETCETCETCDMSKERREIPGTFPPVVLCVGFEAVSYAVYMC